MEQRCLESRGRRSPKAARTRRGADFGGSRDNEFDTLWRKSNYELVKYHFIYLIVALVFSLYTEQKYKTQHVKCWLHVSGAEIKNPRKVLYAQKAYFCQIVCTNLFTSLLVSISPLAR
jgi:hypothetical protein